MWECGLKQTGVTTNSDVWESLLMWECGLKQSSMPCTTGCPGVTPYVGVWIETVRTITDEEKAVVTPYVGVWIETYTNDALVLC